MKNILFYGDSNTWGFNPETGLRYPYEKRWTTICANLLGADYNCIPSGMNGRASIFDDPLKGCRNALTGLDYVLQTHKPLDLMVIMLGTNDLKYTDAEGSAKGMERLLKDAVTANERYNLSSPVFPNGAKILLVSPVRVENKEWFGTAQDASRESEKFAGLYSRLAEQLNEELIKIPQPDQSGKVLKVYDDPAMQKHVYFLDAAPLTSPSSVDGVHLSAEGHAIIGRAIAGKIQEL